MYARATGFYSTYEALKLKYGFCFVLPNFRFLLYLWGIETKTSGVSAEQQTQTFLLYLWGIETYIYQSYSLHMASPFLLYLWGIETTAMYYWILKFRNGFYSTYEALKHKIWAKDKKHGQGFYSTYEALKQFSIYKPKLIFCSFYSTYEALKPVQCKKSLQMEWVFLLYLWGIETWVFGS